MMNPKICRNGSIVLLRIGALVSALFLVFFSSCDSGPIIIFSVGTPTPALQSTPYSHTPTSTYTTEPTNTSEPIRTNCENPFVPIKPGDTYIYKSTYTQPWSSYPHSQNTITVNYTSIESWANPINGTSGLTINYTIVDDLTHEEGDFSRNCNNDGIWENPYPFFYQGFQMPAFSNPVVGYSWEILNDYENGDKNYRRFIVTSASEMELEITANEEIYIAPYTYYSDCVATFMSGKGMTHVECTNTGTNLPDQESFLLIELISITREQ